MCGTPTLELSLSRAWWCQGEAWNLEWCRPLKIKRCTTRKGKAYVRKRTNGWLQRKRMSNATYSKFRGLCEQWRKSLQERSALNPNGRNAAHHRKPLSNEDRVVVDTNGNGDREAWIRSLQIRETSVCTHFPSSIDSWRKRLPCLTEYTPWQLLKFVALHTHYVSSIVQVVNMRLRTLKE